MAEEKAEKENEIDLDTNWIDEVTKREELHKSYQEELKDLDKFFKEFHQLSDFMMAYLKKKYGYLANDLENFLWILDGNRFVQKMEETEKLFQDALNTALNHYSRHVSDKLHSIENKLNILVNKRNNHLLERFLQRLLIKFPQIIEPNLKFIKSEYNLGDTLFRGDILFRDSTETLLYIELKVIVPSYKKLEKQLERYLSYNSKKDRLMYIAPELTLEQERFCKDNNIEFKIINLDEIFN